MYRSVEPDFDKWLQRKRYSFPAVPFLIQAGPSNC